MTIVAGFDLSLSSVGVAVIDTAAGTFYTTAVKPPARIAAAGGHERMAWLCDQLLAHAPGGGLTAVEGPSYGSQGSGRQTGHHERAGLWWRFTHELWLRGLHTAVVPPAALKKYATGKGNAGKDEMLLATARRFEAFAGGNDEADALWLAAMGADHLGTPLAVMPAAHRKALDAVKWPEIA